MRFLGRRWRVTGVVVGLTAAAGTPPRAAPAQPAEVAPPPRSPPSSPRPASACDETTIALALRDLFPPAPAELRVHSALQLAACRVRGAEGALAAALPLSPDDETSVAIAGALAQFRTVVAREALRATVQHGAAPRVRAVAMQALARAGMTEDIVAVINDPDQADESRATALESLEAAGRIPSAPYLAWVTEHAGPNARAVAARLLEESARPDLAHAPAGPASAAGPTAPRTATPQPALAARVPLAPPPPVAAVAPAAPAGPIDGRPLTIAASTVAGAALFLNLSRLGIQDATPQLLLGSAGAVIGFGTSWALSRLGVRPTVEQAAWFANTTAWGTLAGVALYGGSNLDNYKLRYGALIAGEMVGMAAGVWSGRRWSWTASQVALSDSILLGVALTAVGAQRLQGEAPGASPAVAIGVVPVMIAAAIAGHALSPTRNDLILMTDLGVSGAWLGSLVASGAAGTSWLGSYQGQGGLIAGAGVGYLAGAAAGAFSDVDPARVRMGAYAMLAGNALGLGAHMASTGLDRGASGLAPGDSDRWRLGAGLGGVALGALGFAVQPHLHLRSRTAAMQLWGVSYAAGVYGLGSWASNQGARVTDANTATLRGGMLAFGVTGGVTGLLLSQRHEPDPQDQWTAFGLTAAGLTAGWGAARLLTDTSGEGEGIGIAAGAAVGLTAGALFTHSSRLTAPALGAATLGTAYGGLMGLLLPSSVNLRWQENRATGGGALLGLGAGALVGGTLAQGTGASGRDVAATSFATVLGLGVGAGAGLMLRPSDTDSRAPRVGAMAGATAFAGGAMLLGHALRLNEPRPPEAPGLAVTTTMLGLGDGLWLAALLDPTGTPGGARADRLSGGLLFGGALGLSTGMILAPYLHPDTPQLLVLTSATAIGTGVGRGVALLASDTAGRADSMGTLAGALVGTAGGAWAAMKLQTFAGPNAAPGAAPVLGATSVGLLYGGFLGALTPQLAMSQWTTGRPTEGGSWVGLGAGAIGGAAVAQLTRASSREVADAAIAGVLGAGVGLGAGTMLTDGDSQGMRIGTAVGTAASLGAEVLLGRALHLDAPMPDSALRLIDTATALGVFDGVWLAAIVDPRGSPSGASGQRLRGGVLLGGALGLGTGLALAPRLTPASNQLLLVATATAASTAMGRGISELASAEPGRADSIGTLAGALAGTVGGAVAAVQLADFDATDVGALSLGAGTGALLGGLGPSLFERQWPGLRRDTAGALWLGLGAGAFLGDATRRGSGASAREVALAGAAALDGLATGIGFGLLLRSRSTGSAPTGNSAADDSGGDSDRPIRLGMAAGTVAGLGLGMATWSRQTLGPGDGELVLASVALAAWNGALVPRLGHASSDDVDGQRVAGGLLGAAGTASFVAAMLAPHLTIDPDLVEDALMMDAVFSGLGLGVGELVSARADAPVWGLLGAGAVGLAMGGALHDRIDIDRGAIPLLTFGTGEGLWTGALVPYLLHRQDEVNDRQRGAGALAGLFGGIGISMLVNAAVEPSSGAIAAASVGSGIGASVAGGVALVSEQLHDQLAAGLTLGGTALGAGAGGLLASRLRLDGSAVGHATVGGILGTAEALTFAWSARASERDPLLGAGLIGAGIGTSLGLAAAATMNDGHTQTPVLAGFAAWGAWMGAFTGSLSARDPHEITAGALLGANVGFLAGYGLIETELVAPGDFGWLSLGAALGTAVGAGVGAPFASRGEPRPILGGLAIGSVVGMTVGALVISRFEHSAKVADASALLRSPAGARWPVSPLASSATSEGSTAGEAASFARSSSTATSSPGIAAELDRNSATRRRLLRAIDASIRIEDCAPLIGALPSSRDAPPTTGTPPILIGLTGRWH